jgi:lipopolysaccharide export system permease protein
MIVDPKAKTQRKRGKNQGGKNRRLDSYLLEEIAPLLITGLLVVILLFLLAALYEIVAPILAKGANPLLVLRLLAFSLPESFGRAFPIAVLFAVSLGFSRLTSDSEIKSILAGGIAPNRLVLPILGLSFGVAIISFLNNELLVPKASSVASQIQRDIVLDNPRVLVQEKAVFKDGLNRAIYIDKINPDQSISGIRIIQMAAHEAPKEMIQAERGKIERDSAQITLYNGQRITYTDSVVSTASKFAELHLPVQDLQATLTDNGGPSSRAMRTPISTLLEEIRDSKAKGLAVYAEETALHRKFAEPLAAVAFGFFGVMLALFTLRSSSGVGVVWTVFLTFFYYATWSTFRVMGQQGAILPVIAAWTPDLIYVGAGLILWWLSSRR